MGRWAMSDDQEIETTQQPPQITSFTPTSGPALSIVTINGFGFSLNSSENLVIVQGVVAPSRTLSANQIQIILPEGLEAGEVVVSIDSRGVSSNESTFSIVSSATPDVITRLSYALDFTPLPDLGPSVKRGLAEIRITEGGDTIFPGSFTPNRGIFPAQFFSGIGLSSFGVASIVERGSLYATPLPGRTGLSKDTPVPDLSPSPFARRFMSATTNGLAIVEDGSINFFPLPATLSNPLYTPVSIPSQSFDPESPLGSHNSLLSPGAWLETLNAFARFGVGVSSVAFLPAKAGPPSAPPVPLRNASFSIAPDGLGSATPFLGGVVLATDNGVVRIAGGIATFIPFPPSAGRPIGSPVPANNPDFNPLFSQTGSSQGEPTPFRSTLEVAVTNGLVIVDGDEAKLIPVPAEAGQVICQPVTRLNPSFSFFPSMVPEQDEVRLFLPVTLLVTEKGVVEVDGSNVTFTPIPAEAGRVISPAIVRLNPEFDLFFPLSHGGSPRPFLSTLLLTTTNGMLSITDGKVDFLPVPFQAGQVITPPILGLNPRFNPRFDPHHPSGEPFPFERDLLLGTTNGVVVINDGTTSFTPLPMGSGMPVGSPIPVATPGVGTELLIPVTNGLVKMNGNGSQFLLIPSEAGQVVGAPFINEGGQVLLAVSNGLVQVRGTVVSFLPLPGASGVVISSPIPDAGEEGGERILLATSHGFASVEGDSITFLPLPDGAGRNVAPRLMLCRSPVENQLPLADAGLDRTADVGASVTFDGSASSDPDGTIVGYLWDFGDGTTASGRVVRHSFTHPGTVTVMLTVTDNIGATASDSVVMTILDRTPPQVSLQVPTGGEMVLAGTSLTIRWFSTDNVAVTSHDVLLATDGFNFSLPLATNLGGSAQSFNWFVPTTLATTTARIRVIARDAVGLIGQSESGLFTVRDTIPPAVSVQAPLGGETLTPGFTFTIRWHSFDNTSVISHDILLAVDGFNFSTTVVSGLSGSAQSFIWPVEASLVTTTARLRVVARDAAGNSGLSDSGVFAIRDTVPPSVNVTKPFSGQVLNGGSTFTIRWTSRDNVGVTSQDVLLSTDGGFSFLNVIASGLSGSRSSFRWSVPNNLVAAQAVIRIVARDAAANAGQGDSRTFVIRDTRPPAVTVRAPSAGQIVNPGAIFTIAWDSTDNVGIASQDILLSTNGGASFSITVVAGLAGGQQMFNWAVPANLDTHKARIRVQAFDAAGNRGRSDTGSFTIRDNTPPTVSVISPVAGRSVSPGTEFAIRWSSSDNIRVTFHEIQFSGNGGQTFSTLVSGLSGTQHQFVWSVPNIDTPQARIRVVARDAPGNRGQAETGDFAIRDTVAPTVAVLLPAAGQSVGPGTLFTIQWSSTDNIGIVSQEIRLSTNAGRSFPTLVATGLTGTQQSFAWSVPGTLNTSRARLRVIARDGAGNQGRGDSGSFKIRDTLPPSVSLIQPVGGEILQLGSQFLIRWSSDDNTGVASHDIFLSTGGGSSFSPIIRGLSGGLQSFAWDVPSTVATNRARVRVEARDGAGNRGLATSGEFTIQDRTPPSVVVLRPTAGDVISAGSRFVIRWKASDNVNVTSQEIQLSINGGATFPIVVASGLSGSKQSFSWTVPPGHATRQAVIRVIARDGSANEGLGDSGRFTLRGTMSAPSVRLVFPNGGEVVNGGDSLNIQWVSTDDRGIVSHDVLLSTDGGRSFNVPIQTGLAGSHQSFIWLVPSGLSTNRGRIRVIAHDADGLTGRDESDRNFTIHSGGGPTGQFALVASGDLTILGNLQGSGSVLGTVPVRGNAVEVAVAPNGQFAIALMEESRISVISGLGAGTPRQSVSLELNGKPVGAAISRDSRSAVILVDTRPVRVVPISGLPNNPAVGAPFITKGFSDAHDLALSPSGTVVFTASRQGIEGLGVVDNIFSKPKARLPGLVRTGSDARGVILSKDGDMAFVVSRALNRIFIVSGLTPGDQPSLERAVIEEGVGTSPGAIDISVDGSTAVLTNEASHSVSIYRVGSQTLHQMETVPAGKRPGGVAISSDGNTVIVANSGDQSVSLITSLRSGVPGKATVGPSSRLRTEADREQALAIVP